LKKNNSLKTLSLIDNKITKKGVIEIIDLMLSNENIKEVYLRDNEIDFYKLEKIMEKINFTLPIVIGVANEEKIYGEKDAIGNFEKRYIYLED